MHTVEKRERGGETESSARLRWSSTEKSEEEERDPHSFDSNVLGGHQTERLQRCSDFGKV